jgi:flagellar biosynthetic protein FliP
MRWLKLLKKCSFNALKLAAAGPWLILAGILVLLIFNDTCLAQTKIPTLSLNLAESESPDAVVPAMKIVGMLTLLAIAPAILLMMTSFTRILIVLSFVRQALGTQSMPPNQILVGLALFLTFFTMSPVIDKVNKAAYTPYVEKTITAEQAFEEALKPVREFMMREVRKDDLGLFLNMAKLPKPNNESEIPMTVVLPSFMVSELTTAFQIGFLIYIPFLVIDMVVSSILMAMGMMMLPPTVVSLPFKLVIFVLIDGWSLIADSIVKSFAGSG